MNTIYLDPDSWDVTVDAFGNIALATDDYAPIQDVASACRLFKGEALFDASRGVPYEDEILGKLPSVSLLEDWIQTEALTVPGVAEALPVLTYADRTLGGQIQIKLNNGAVINDLTI